jgi:hypothetical protein
MFDAAGEMLWKEVIEGMLRARGELAEYKNIRADLVTGDFSLHRHIEIHPNFINSRLPNSPRPRQPLHLTYLYLSYSWI